MEVLAGKLSNSSMGQSSAAGGSQSVDHIASVIIEFLYACRSISTLSSGTNDTRTCSLLIWLPRTMYGRCDSYFANWALPSTNAILTSILPKDPREIPFADMLKTLSQMFCEQSSLFNTLFQCLQRYKRKSDEFIT
ncbi:unnamed protein product [Schistocephalus solidus]|uniref:Mediator of RNA polymerase II transcription subunit 23 n=1 Tax=Schistocephalus solidus TaxID=70667 RepID=A0A183T5D5_SCHSO|nr:unnamed protein product [Schistocephalus solidus]